MAKGKIAVDIDKCKGCELCITACRHGVIALGPVERTNAQGYRYLEVVHPESCTGCAMCAQMCPDGALTVWRESGKGKA